MKRKIFKTVSLVIVTLFIAGKSEGQNIYTFAGSGNYGGAGSFSGDGGAANLATLSDPIDMTVDAAGNVYIVDYINARIRKVNTAGIITTIAGTGVQGYGGDGGPATSAKLNGPVSIAIDASGNIYIGDYGNDRVRKINTSGIISTFAGTGVGGFSGDGGTATSAKIDGPMDLTFDGFGNLFIADINNSRIRKVNALGIISTYAGNGTQAYGGDGGNAINAQLNGPMGIAFDASNNLYIADWQNGRIRKVNSSGIISTYAGTGSFGDSGDGGQATNAQIAPRRLAVDAAGNLLFTVNVSYRVRKINSSGIISAFAGTGAGGFAGDGGPALAAHFESPEGITVDGNGNVYIADGVNNRIRIVCNSNCVTGIETISEYNDDISLFPNPSSDVFHIRLGKDIENGEVILVNSLGQKVLQQRMVQGTNEIKTSALLSGLYSYILFQNNNTIKTGKISIEH